MWISLDYFQDRVFPIWLGETVVSQTAWNLFEIFLELGRNRPKSVSGGS